MESAAAGRVAGRRQLLQCPQERRCPDHDRGHLDLHDDPEHRGRVRSFDHGADGPDDRVSDCPVATGQHPTGAAHVSRTDTALLSWL